MASLPSVLPVLTGIEAPGKGLLWSLGIILLGWKSLSPWGKSSLHRESSMRQYMLHIIKELAQVCMPLLNTFVGENPTLSDALKMGKLQNGMDFHFTINICVSSPLVTLIGINVYFAYSETEIDIKFGWSLALAWVSIAEVLNGSAVLLVGLKQRQKERI
uniref:Uncharacterized protein n=1 Tax=Pelusios castaneus TaxID=367368 RepID=A0A8C8R809_9SAUR